MHPGLESLIIVVALMLIYQTSGIFIIFRYKDFEAAPKAVIVERAIQAPNAAHEEIKLLRESPYRPLLSEFLFESMLLDLSYLALE